MFDAIVIGGGPAGSSAAIYLARFNRSVLIVDAGEGRSTSRETNQNYFGFPRGIRSRDLRRRGLQQAKRFGADIAEGRVTSIRRSAAEFTARAGRSVFHGRTLILATGVVDRFPNIENIEQCLGISLFWCITCDGWNARNKKVVLVGNSDEAATTALQLLNFTDDVCIVTNNPRTRISRTKRLALARAAIPIVADHISSVASHAGKVRTVETSGGRPIPVDVMFSSLGSTPNVDLARSLGVKLDAGYIATDPEQRTSVRGVYAAGDVTKAFAHQIVTAAHEGATAAQAANYDLYESHQRE